MTDVEVRGTYLLADDTPAAGRVVFTPRAAVVNDNADGNLLIGADVVATLDAQGSFTVTLQASDDVAIDPSGWTYAVQEEITGSRPLFRNYDIDIPVSAAGPGVDLVDVAPVTPESGDPSAFPTLAAVAALDARIDVLESAPAGRARLSDGIFSTIDAALDSGGTAAIQVQGDSTGNATDEWVYLLGQWAAARHTDAHVKYKVWSDATQAYGSWSTLQAGPSGEVHAPFDAANLRTMFIAQAEIPHVPGDFDIRVRAALDDWTPAATMCLAARYGAAGSRGWRVAINTSGGIDFLWTTDGTTNIQKVTATPTGFANGTEGWVRVTLDVDNGAGGYTWKAYTSTDGVTWTEIGSSITAVGGATSFFDAPQEYEIGGRGSTGELTTGKIFEVQLRDGIDGRIINPQPITAWMPRIASGQFLAGHFAGGPTLYILNGSHPGAASSYLADATRHPKMVHPYPGSLIFQSCSHNDGSSFGAAYVAARDAWLALTDARAPGSQTVILTQNPEVSPIAEPSIHAHAVRRRLLSAWAARSGLVLVDVYKRFLDAPGGAASLLQADGIHPTVSIGDGTKGEDVWLDAITDAWTSV